MRGRDVPLWLRVYRDTSDADSAGLNLRQANPHTTFTDDATGHTWLPLVVPTGVAGAVMVSSLAGQIMAAMQAIGQKG